MSRSSVRPRRLAALVAATVVAVVAVVVAGAGDPGPVPSVEAAPPAQRVLLVTDSVGLGAKGALPGAFPSGWDVTTIGEPARFVHQLESQYVRPALAATPWIFGDHVVVAGGYNYEYWDPDRFDRSVDSLIATLTAAGVKHVHWVTLREVKPQYISPSAWSQVQPYFWYFPRVNQHLRDALLRHPNLHLVDWAAAADRPGITYDAIHLNTAGAELYSSLIRRSVDRAATSRPDGSVTRIDVTDDPSTDAVAVNVTVTGTRRHGHLTAFPCEEDVPVASNLNFGRADTIAGAAIVPVGPSGDVCVYNSHATQVVVDLFGRFDDAVGLDLDVPRRVLDSRGGGRQPAGVPRAVPIVGPGAAPAGTTAAALIVTAVRPAANGHVTVHRCDEPLPPTSNLNFRTGTNTPNMAIVEPDADGRVCVTPSAPTHLVVDVFASFGDDGTVDVVGPLRVANTRRTGRPGDGGVVRIPTGGLGLDPDVTGLMVNLTIAEAAGNGHATAYPCDDGRPPTSNLNYGPGVARANMVTVRPDGDGDVCVAVSRSAHVIVDLLATVGDGFTGVAGRRLLDTRR